MTLQRPFSRLLFGGVCSLLACFASFMVAQPRPQSDPVLRIETGMHTAFIRRIAVDAAYRYFVSASDDKTVRVWDLASGQLLRVLRVPIGKEQEGQIFAVAISPDGSTVAVGVRTKPGEGDAICIFDRESGRMIHRISDLPGTVLHLVYSQAGDHLAATLAGKNGVRVFAAPSYTEIGADKGYDDDCYGADFSRDGKLAVSSFDGFIRTYTVSRMGLSLIHKKRTGFKGNPFDVKFSPDGSLIAIGSDDEPEIEVRNSIDLSSSFSVSLPMPVAGDDLSSVAWSTTGDTLFGANAGKTGQINAWDGKGRGSLRVIPIPLAGSNIVSMVSLPGSRLLYAAADLSIGIQDLSKTRNDLILRPPISDHRMNLDCLRLSPDGLKVQFCNEARGVSPMTFDIARREMSSGELPAGTAAVRKSEPLKVEGWENGYSPTVNGRPLELEKFELVRSLAIAPKVDSFVLGTEWRLRLFDKGGESKRSVTVPDVAWAVNISPDGKLAVAAHGDGTIRWYRMSDLQEILALFPHSDKKRWILWTPSGYYDASPGAEDLIGWHVNHGPNAAADFFPVGQFRDVFYRPDVVSRILKTLDEQLAFKEAEDSKPLEWARLKQVSVVDRLPPIVEITSPKGGTDVSNKVVKITYEVRTPTTEPVTSVKVLVDGRPVDAEIPAKAGKGEVSVEIPQKDAEIAIIAENRFTPSVPATVKLHWIGEKLRGQEVIEVGGNTIRKPKLYLLAIGVSVYKEPSLKLDYAAKDASDFVAAMLKQKPGFYREAEVQVLTDANATGANVEDALDWISLATTSGDTAMIFVSGHGHNDVLNRYYFLPQDYNPAKPASTGVISSYFERAVAAIKGKVVLFVDTCHAGNAFGTSMDGFVNGLSRPESGVVVFAASTGSQTSVERPEWENGAFTEALLEGLSGEADLFHDGDITVASLEAYVDRRVAKLTQGKQTPAVAKPRTIADFTVALK